MRHRVVIQSEEFTDDGQGGTTTEWVSGDTVYASIKPLKGWEQMQAQQMQTPVTHKIVMRYRSDVTTATRLKLGSRLFGVKEAINEEERNRFLIIKAIETAGPPAILLEDGEVLLMEDGTSILTEG
jgi:SPP1 family predicted phage head-tail adaptor